MSTSISPFSCYSWRRYVDTSGKRQQADLIGQAAIQLTSTQNPNVVSVSILGLTLEGKHFLFRPRIKAITGTLDLRTGAFSLTLSFRRLRTPETLQPFTWDGTADGVYDFDTGVVSLTEIGQGAFLTK